MISPRFHALFVLPQGRDEALPSRTDRVEAKLLFKDTQKDLYNCDVDNFFLFLMLLLFFMMDSILNQSGRTSNNFASIMRLLKRENNNEIRISMEKMTTTS